MEGNNEIPRVTADSDSVLDREAKAFRIFLEEGGYTKEQVERAYEHLMGVADSEIEPESLRTLVAEMKRLEELGHPVNLFPRLANEIGMYETSRSRFGEITKAMHFSQREVWALESIIDKKRSGLLSFYKAGSQDPFVNVDISLEDASQSKTDKLKSMIAVLDEVVKRGGEKRVEVSFEER